MALAYRLPQKLPWNLSHVQKSTSIVSNVRHRHRPPPPRRILQIICAENKKRCLRCNTMYEYNANSTTACSFHGHSTGERGLFALAPPHQGIDGEWSDKSGVTVYRWNQKDNRPNTGISNWKKRWSCCAEYDENAPPCRKGWHVSYDDGFTIY